MISEYRPMQGAIMHFGVMVIMEKCVTYSGTHEFDHWPSTSHKETLSPAAGAAGVSTGCGYWAAFTDDDEAGLPVIAMVQSRKAHSAP
jgi:hypothetical protein